MAYIQIYFDGDLTEEVELRSVVTKIGRSTENNIKIENAGVSARHALIVRDAEQYMVVDAGSTNGLYVNGRRVERHVLSYGDEISVLKHTLRFAAEKSEVRTIRVVSEDTHQVEQGATVGVDVSNLAEIVKDRAAKPEAYVLLADGERTQTPIPLTKVNFRIGKGKDNDIAIADWFAPRVAASIKRREGRFCITPRRGGNVRLNGTPLSAEAELKDGDNLSVRGVTLKFCHRPAER